MNDRGTRNVIEGGTLTGPVIMGHDIHVSLPAPEPFALAGLPPDVPDFTGRPDELGMLADVLNPANVDGPVVAVSGLAGVGKTALVLRAAHRALSAGWFSGGVLFIDLNGYDPQQRLAPGEAVAGLLRALGVGGSSIPPHDDERSRLFRSMLAPLAAEQRPVLLLIDNAATASDILPLLPGDRGHRVLVTSRHTLTGLPGTRFIDLDVMEPESAVILLRNVLRAADPADRRADASGPELPRIAEECGYLPLALRIAAALLAGDRDCSLAEFMETLTGESDRLAELELDDSLSVRAAFNLSYRHLSPSDARMFRFLAAHPGPEISVEAAAALADQDAGATRRLLRSLRFAHLIESGSRAGCVKFHDLMLRFGRERHLAEDSVEADITALWRLQFMYTRYAYGACALLYDLPTGDSGAPLFSSIADAIDWVHAERINLLSAMFLMGLLSRSLDNDVGKQRLFDEVTKKLARPVSLCFLALGYAGEATATLTHEIDICRRLGDGQGEERAQGDLEGAARAERLIAEAAGHLEEMHGLGQLPGNAYRSTIGLATLVNCDAGQITKDDKINVLRTLADCREKGDIKAQAGFLGALGDAYFWWGNFSAAIHYHKQEFTVCRAIGDRDGQATALAGIGRACLASGHVSDALECFRSAIDAYETHSSMDSAILRVIVDDLGRHVPART